MSMAKKWQLETYLLRIPNSLEKPSRVDGVRDGFLNVAPGVLV
jgi:hypothetical protein